MILCGILHRNESTALGASPLLTDKLPGMKCAFTVGPSHTEAETGRTAHVTDPGYITERKQMCIKETLEFIYVPMLYKSQRTGNFSVC